MRLVLYVLLNSFIKVRGTLQVVFGKISYNTVCFQVCTQTGDIMEALGDLGRAQHWYRQAAGVSDLIADDKPAMQLYRSLYRWEDYISGDGMFFFLQCRHGVCVVRCIHSMCCSSVNVGVLLDMVYMLNVLCIVLLVRT